LILTLIVQNNSTVFCNIVNLEKKPIAKKQVTARERDHDESSEVKIL